MVYITYNDINTHTNLTSSDIANADVTTLIASATVELNQDVQVLVEREEVEKIDDTRENDIDGSNTTYYVKNWKGFYLGDLNNDGVVNTNDVKVYQVTSDGTETELTVSSITHNQGKFVLSEAPATGVSLFVTYCKSPVDMATPDILIKRACIFLTAAYCYAKINFGKAPDFRAGNLRIVRDMDSYNRYYKLYLTQIEKIQDNFGTIDAENLI